MVATKSCSRNHRNPENMIFLRLAASSGAFAVWGQRHVIRQVRSRSPLGVTE